MTVCILNLMHEFNVLFSFSFFSVIDFKIKTTPGFVSFLSSYIIHRFLWKTRIIVNNTWTRIKRKSLLSQVLMILIDTPL